MSNSRLKLLLAILIIVASLLSAFIIDYYLGLSFIEIAGLVVTSVVGAATLYLFIDKLSSDSSEPSDKKSNGQRSETKSETGQTPTSSFSGSTSIGRDYQVGDRTEIGEIHVHKSPNNNRNKTEKGDNVPDQSHEIGETNSSPIPEAVTGGSLNEVYFTHVEREFGLMPITFRTPLFSKHNVHHFTKKVPGDLSFNDFKRALSEIAPLLWDVDTASFTISQEDGQWYGYGLHHFIKALSEPEARYERDYTGRKHGNEAAVCLLGVEGGSLLAIGCQPITPTEHNRNRTNPTRNLSIGFLTSGTPVDNTTYQTIAKSFNTKFSQGIQTSEAYVAQITANVQIDPEDFISVGDSTVTSTHWADYAIVRNPFNQNPELKNELQFERQNGQPLSEQYWNKPRKMVGSCKYVPVNIRAGMAPDPAKKRIAVDDVYVTVHSGLTIGHGHCNLEISGSDIDT